jgi:hypothetical protein
MLKIILLIGGLYLILSYMFMICANINTPTKLRAFTMRNYPEFHEEMFRDCDEFDIKIIYIIMFIVDIITGPITLVIYFIIDHN